MSSPWQQQGHPSSPNTSIPLSDREQQHTPSFHPPFNYSSPHTPPTTFLSPSRHDESMTRNEEEGLTELAAPPDAHPDVQSWESSQYQRPPLRRPRSSGTWYHASSIAEEEEKGLEELAAPQPLVPNPPSGQPTPFPSRAQTRRPSQFSSRRSSRLSHFSSQQESSISEISARRLSEQRQRQLNHEDGWYHQQFLEEARYDPEEEHEKEYEDGQQQLSEPRSSQYLTQLYIVSHLIFFTILGTLARLGMQWLTFYPGAPVVIPSLWSNFSGTLFIGFLTEERQLFRAGYGLEAKQKLGRLHASHTQKFDRQPSRDRKAYSSSKKTIPLYIGLSVGFCGSFTSFSTFMRAAFLAFSNDLPAPRDHLLDVTQSVQSTPTAPRSNGYSFNAVTAVMIVTVGLSVAALLVGGHIALALDRVLPTIPFHTTRRFLDPMILFLGWGSWFAAVILAIWPPDRPGGSHAPQSRSWTDEQWRGEVIMSLVFAPLGSLLRFLFAIKLNSLLPHFPIGTFAANMCGTIVMGICWDLQHVPLFAGGLPMAGGGHVGCQVLQGVQDGFCGGLTTVSTWIVELKTLRRRNAWVYGLASTLLGFASLIVVMGSVRWTIGFAPAACGVGRTH